MEFNDKEFAALQDMLQTYRDLQEEVHGCPEDDAMLFTAVQRRLFTRFDVISVTCKTNRG
jgi:hypothetical protein